MDVNIYFYWSKFTSNSLRKRLAADAQSYDLDRNGWTSAERQYCSIFKPYFSAVTKNRFNEDLEFLQLAGDTDTKPMSAFLYAFLFILVLGESFGFNILLASYVGREVTPNVANIVGVVLAFVVAGLLAFITHYVGAQTKKTYAKRACHKEFMELRAVGEEGFMKKIGLGPQNADADRKSYVRTMNRIANSGGDRGSYVMAVIFAVIVVVFAVAMWGIRHTEMISSDTEASAAMGQSSNNASPFPPSAPASMTEAQAAVDKSAAGESAKGKVMSADLAFGVFSLIFLLTQGVGFYGAFTHTFSGGSNSASAYNNTKGFKSYDDYKMTYQPYIDVINAELKAFQSQLKMSGRIDRNYEKTFSDYLALEAAASDSTNSIPPALEKTASAPVTVSIEEAKAKIDTLNTADAMVYIKSLPANIQTDLKPWLLERKAKREEAEKAKSSGLSDQDLENLL
jgi:hypothetical protein